jgi:thiol-disulfide isomerase/thioredoxin
MQLAGALEQIPGGGEVAVTAIKTFGPLFAKSGNDRIKQLAEGFQGKLRLLELPGKPMEIKGALLDGSPFDQATFAGKVVLVDFWATWCGPCVAEIPNMLEQYEKYHDKGFEVVGISLDEDKAEVEKFVADNKIPWPILFAGKGWQDPTAQFRLTWRSRGGRRPSTPPASARPSTSRRGWPTRSTSRSASPTSPCPRSPARRPRARSMPARTATRRRRASPPSASGWKPGRGRRRGSRIAGCW